MKYVDPECRYMENRKAYRNNMYWIVWNRFLAVMEDKGQLGVAKAVRKGIKEWLFKHALWLPFPDNSKVWKMTGRPTAYNNKDSANRPDTRDNGVQLVTKSANLVSNMREWAKDAKARGHVFNPSTQKHGPDGTFIPRNEVVDDE